MGAENRLRARLRPSVAKQIESIANARDDMTEADVERQLVEEGLESMGYMDRPTDGAELFLWYLKRIGLTLGLVGLIMMGYGVFGMQSWGVVGFGLLLGGFLFVVLEEAIKAYEARTAEPVVETAEHA